MGVPPPLPPRPKTVSKDLVLVKRRKLDSESDGESESEGNEESDSEGDDDACIELSDCNGAEGVCDSEEDDEQVPPTTRSQNKLSPNLVPRVLGLLGQRVSARRDSGIIDLNYICDWPLA